MDNRFQSTLTVLLTIGMLAASACSQQRQTPAHGGIQALPFSVVATGDSGADIRSASTFAWASNLHNISHEAGPGNIPLDAMLQEAIVANLQGKGYRYSEVAGEGDLIIAYQVMLGTSGASRDPAGSNATELQPSLNITSPDPGKYEKGTLVIEVTERATGITAWHSALQGFANLELSDAERRQRIRLMVDRMLAGVPAK
jgi:hypothetical protein